MKTGRYSNNKNGFINFPSWEDTGEGGLVVHLFVLGSSDFTKRWEICIDDNDFMGDLTFTSEMQGWFPDRDIDKSYYGREVLLCMKLASTGLSLWDGDEYFRATKNDLNEDGRNLYILLEKLYPGCEILITTTLDT